jgi:hypothetical protein
MKLCALVCLATLLLAPAGYGRRAAKHREPAGTLTWKLDNLKKIGGNPVTVIGNPQVIKDAGRKAVLFDGQDDGLFLDVNPIAAAPAFTIEAVIRPDAGGAEEQRWFHIQEAEGDDRVMLETRLHGGEWFLDTFIKNGAKDAERRTLYDEKFKHPAGRWYHVALVYDGSSMRNYVDGKEELSGPLAVPPLDRGRTSIGMRQNRVYWFKGAISRARFTPRALKSSEFMGNN